MVGSVVRSGRPYRAAEGRQPALPGQAGRLPRPELRKDHQDLRNRRGLPRNRAGRGGRMDRAHQRPPASGEGAMNSIWETSMASSGARDLSLSLVAGRSGAVRPGRRTRSSRSPARSRPAPRSIRIELSEAARGACRRASPSRRRRASRIDLPGVDQRPRQVDGRDQPGQPALGQRGPGRRAHAPGPEPEGSRPATGRSSTARSLIVSLENNAPATLAQLERADDRRASPKA